MNQVSLAAASALLDGRVYRGGSGPTRTAVYLDPQGGATMYVNHSEVAAICQSGRLWIWEPAARVWEDRVSALPGVRAFRRHGRRRLALGPEGQQTPPFPWPAGMPYLDLGPPVDAAQCWAVGAKAALQSTEDPEHRRDTVVRWIAAIDDAAPLPLEEVRRQLVAELLRAR